MFQAPPPKAILDSCDDPSLWQQLCTLVTFSFFLVCFLACFWGGFVFGVGIFIFFCNFIYIFVDKFSSYKTAFAPTSSLQILSKQNKAWVGGSLVWSCSREYIPAAAAAAADLKVPDQ